MENETRSGRVKAILVGGLVAAVLDAVDALVAYRLAFGMTPAAIYQFVASGLLGKAAFARGAPTALLGLGIHFLIAFTVAAMFVLASERLLWLRRDPVGWGLVYGLLVFLVMNIVVIPLSRIPASPLSLPLLLNGAIGHALLVGLPISRAARRFLGRDGRTALASAVA